MAAHGYSIAMLMRIYDDLPRYSWFVLTSPNLEDVDGLVKETSGHCSVSALRALLLCNHRYFCLWEFHYSSGTLPVFVIICCSLRMCAIDTVAVHQIQCTCIVRMAF